ncbi:EAL and HDOD domain-containing protein [Oceanidesulfovibrio indonesiensis]|nr:HDOD domain-containing protein [Oceanidesulfovibrio indonesiensis]
MADAKPDAVYIDTFFARQPIFDRKKEPRGYALLYRHSSDATTAHFDDKDIATLTVIANAIMNMPKEEKARKKLFITFTEEPILRKIPLALPAETTVLAVDESIAKNREVLKTLMELKADDYQIALNDYSGAPGSEVLLKLADIVFVDVLDGDKERIGGLVDAVKPHKCVLAAKRVEHISHFELARELGFSLFQGFFFEKPEIVPGRKLSSSQISRLMLFRALEKENPEFDELASIIESDVAISYRLLALINSAAFSLSRKVESIKQALVLLGLKQVKSWLWLIFLSDITPEEKTSELPYLSTIRGKFLERAALNHDRSDPKPDSLYLLGLFSLLEALLDIPFADIAENLPLDEKIIDALCGQENELTPWLEMAKLFERGEWDNIDEIIEKLQLDPMTVANSYAEALTWAKSIQEESARIE